MAGIIVAENSNTTNQLIGELYAPLRALVEQEYEAQMSSDNAKALDMIFPEFGIETHSASIGGMVGSGSFAPVGENGAYPQGGIEDGYLSTFIPETWKGSFAVSMEMMEDKLSGIIAGQPKAFIADYWRARSNFFWSLLGAAVTNKDALTMGGRKFSVKTKDGTRLFSQTHKTKIGQKAQANAFSDAFSATALSKASTAMQNILTDSDQVGGVNPDTIIIPNIAEAKAEVFGVLGANHDPETQAGNKYNYLFGNWRVICSPFLVPFASGAEYPWILMDSEYNRKYYGGLNVERKPLTVTNETAGNDAYLWKGNARFTGGFHDFRAFACGGVDYGKALA